MQRLDELQARSLAAMRREGRSRADRLLRLRRGAHRPLAGRRARGAAAADGPCERAPRPDAAARTCARRRPPAIGPARTAHHRARSRRSLRGYAIVTVGASGEVLRDVRHAPAGTADRRAARARSPAGARPRQGTLNQRYLRRSSRTLRAPLSWRALVASSGERIVLAAEIHAHGRAFQLERLAVAIDEVATVVLGRPLGLGAMDHDDRRVAPALVRIAQADAPTANERRLVLSDRGLEHARQLRRRHLAHGGGMRRANGIHELPTPLPCRAEM